MKLTPHERTIHLTPSYESNDHPIGGIGCWRNDILKFDHELPYSTKCSSSPTTPNHCYSERRRRKKLIEFDHELNKMV